jgi:hypothetical protein
LGGGQYTQADLGAFTKAAAGVSNQLFVFLLSNSKLPGVMLYQKVE